MPELPRQVNAALRAPLLELIPSALRANPASFSLVESCLKRRKIRRQRANVETLQRALNGLLQHPEHPLPNPLGEGSKAPSATSPGREEDVVTHFWKIIHETWPQARQGQPASPSAGLCNALKVGSSSASPWCALQEASKEPEQPPTPQTQPLAELSAASLCRPPSVPGTDFHANNTPLTTHPR